MYTKQLRTSINTFHDVLKTAMGVDWGLIKLIYLPPKGCFSGALYAPLDSLLLFCLQGAHAGLTKSYFGVFLPKDLITLYILLEKKVSELNNVVSTLKYNCLNQSLIIH